MNQSDFPLALKTRDVANILGVSQVKVYDIIRRPGFPVIRDGRKLIIPRDAFFKWFNEEAFAQAK